MAAEKKTGKSRKKAKKQAKPTVYALWQHSTENFNRSSVFKVFYDKLIDNKNWNPATEYALMMLLDHLAEYYQVKQIIAEQGIDTKLDRMLAINVSRGMKKEIVDMLINLGLVVGKKGAKAGIPENPDQAKFETMMNAKKQAIKNKKVVDINSKRK